MLRHALILTSACVLTLPVQAADTPDLARQVQALQQLAVSLDARLDKLESTAQQNPQLLGLLKEVEALKSDIAKLRGQAEVQEHQLDTLGKRQNDLYADLDQRVADLAKAAKPAPPPEAAKPATPGGAAAAVDPQLESRSYEEALNRFRANDYAGAIAGFQGFLKAYPGSTLAPNAQYWVGYSYYALKDYKSALAQQQKLVAVYPESTKVPDALLNIGLNQIELKNTAAGRKTLESIVAKYPGSNAATLASRRLAALK